MQPGLPFADGIRVVSGTFARDGLAGWIERRNRLEVSPGLSVSFDCPAVLRCMVALM